MHFSLADFRALKRSLPSYKRSRIHALCDCTASPGRAHSASLGPATHESLPINPRVLRTPSGIAQFGKSLLSAHRVLLTLLVLCLVSLSSRRGSRFCHSALISAVPELSGGAKCHRKRVIWSGYTLYEAPFFDTPGPKATNGYCRHRGPISEVTAVLSASMSRAHFMQMCGGKSMHVSCCAACALQSHQLPVQAASMIISTSYVDDGVDILQPRFGCIEITAKMQTFRMLCHSFSLIGYRNFSCIPKVLDRQSAGFYA